MLFQTSTKGYIYGPIGRTIREIRPSPWGSRGVRYNDDILLFHSKTATAEALDEVLSWLASESYTFDALMPAWRNGASRE